MAKSMRSKREKRLRAIRRELVEPIYEKKEAAKLAAQEAALAASKLPVKSAPSAAMDFVAAATTSANDDGMGYVVGFPMTLPRFSYSYAVKILDFDNVSQSYKYLVMLKQLILKNVMEKFLSAHGSMCWDCLYIPHCCLDEVGLVLPLFLAFVVNGIESWYWFADVEMADGNQSLKALKPIGKKLKKKIKMAKRKHHGKGKIRKKHNV
ncbi:UNVERIFIED_CONTAM: hypothetical protein Sindi_2084300 [Sesamum indicum]